MRGVGLLYPPSLNATGWGWLALAAALAGFAFQAAQQREGENLPAPRPAAFNRVNRLALGFGLMLLALILAAVAVFNLALFDNHQAMRWVWLTSLIVLVAASAVVGALGPGLSRGLLAAVPPKRRHLLWEALGVMALIALAVFLRIYRLRAMPPGIFVDETNAALDAIRILEGRPDSPFGTGWFETPTMYAFYLVGLFKLFGTTFTALKAASLIPAILTVAALYPLARLLFGVPTALAATFLLAISRWHITMSRWGWNEVAPLLFMIAALYFLQRALRDRRASDFALGGLLLGLGHYTYLASRLAALTVALYLLYRLLFERGFARRTWRGLLVFVLLYSVTFAPLLVTYARNPFSFTNRSQQVSILVDMQAAYAQGQPAPTGILAALLRTAGLPADISLAPLQASINHHLAMFLSSGDLNPRHNLPGAPLLDPVTGGLLLLALGFALWQVFKPNGPRRADMDTTAHVIGGHRYALLLLWLLVPLLGGILTRLDEAPQAYRTLPVIGAVALLAGDAVVRSARLLGAGLAQLDRGRDERWLRTLPVLAAVVLLAWAGIFNYKVFFDVQAHDGRVWQAFSPIETAVATEVVDAMDDHSLYLSPRLYHFSPLKFLAYRSVQQGGGGLDHPAYVMADPAADLPLTDPFAQDARFLLDTYFKDVPELFLAYYPGAQFEEVAGPGGQPLYLSVNVPGDEISALQGLLMQVGELPAQRTTMAPRFLPAQPAAQPGGDGGLVTWRGSLNIPASGEYSFQVDGPGELRLDGTVWAADQRRFLGKGLHNLHLTQTATDTRATIALNWLTPGAAMYQPVPPNFFFTVTAPTHGLRGEYFLGDLWEGEAVFTRVDPLLLFAWPEAEPWPAPFSVRWTGTLTVPTDGMYSFQVNADDGVRMWLDEQLVGESVVPDNVNLIQAQRELTAGPHSIRIDYFQRGGGKALELWWQPPNGALQPVPSRVLTPTP